MNKVSKLGRLIICLGALLAVVVLFCLLRPSGPPRYQTFSMIVVSAYTNVFLTPSFEQHMIGALPAIRRLDVALVTSAPTAGSPAVTNGAVFTLYIVGATAPAATNTANAAALQFQQIVLKDYGINGRIFPAFEVHQFSVFRDVFQPRLEELFEW